jgi:hypothetical protein
MILSSVISVPCYLLFGSHLSLSLSLSLSLTMVMADFALVISLHGFPQSLVKVGADMVGHNGADDEPGLTKIAHTLVKKRLWVGGCGLLTMMNFG